MAMKPLRSMQVPGSDNTFYVSHPYIYHGKINSRMIAYTTLDTEVEAIVDIYYDNHFASVYCDNTTAYLLQGNIPGAKLHIIKNDEQIILTFKLKSENEGKLVTAISVSGHAVQPASGDIIGDEKELSLTANENTPTVYSGAGIPDNSLGQPGDLYIKISDPSTETGG